MILRILLFCLVGKPNKTGDTKIDKINQAIVNISNVYMNNRFTEGNILMWDLYLTHPELVDKDEYMKHVEKMREIISIMR